MSVWMSVFTCSTIQTSDGQADMSMQGNSSAIARNTNIGGDCGSAGRGAIGFHFAVRVKKRKGSCQAAEMVDL